MSVHAPRNIADGITILGIESSCDETAAAVVRGGRSVLSNIVATQHELHAEFAGVVPEIASRAHLERLLPVIRAALRDAGCGLADIDAVAVGNRPGLIGSLIVGVAAAKALAWTLGRPLLAVDHIIAHLHAAALNDEPIGFPAIGLVVSGGHTALYSMASPLELERLGGTIDDAMGEAYDKAATMLELEYPGGPAIDRIAAEGDDRAHDFPVATLDRRGYDVSFSGLKTALLYAVRGQPPFQRSAEMLSAREKADFAASFQRAAVTTIMKKVELALDSLGHMRTLVIGGGVSANTRLRAEATAAAASRSVTLRMPPLEYCVDNAAMIAGLGFEHYQAGLFATLDLGASTSSAAGAAS